MSLRNISAASVTNGGVCGVVILIARAAGFVDDVTFSVARKSILENVRSLEIAGLEAKKWEGEDGACFEDDKSDLIHHSSGRKDYSGFRVRFGNHGPAFYGKFPMIAEK